MRLYIANTTKQHQHIMLNIPEMSSPYQMVIPHGEQREIYPERGFSNSGDIDITLKHMTSLPKPFLVPVSEALKSKSFVGLIYSIDKPVPKNAMGSRLEMNEAAQTKQSIEDMARDAQFTRKSIEETTEGATIGNVEVSVTSQEDGRKTTDPDRTVEVVAEGHTPKTRHKSNK
jgi:hypothetical protein